MEYLFLNLQLVRLILVDFILFSRRGHSMILPSTHVDAATYWQKYCTSSTRQVTVSYKSLIRPVNSAWAQSKFTHWSQYWELYTHTRFCSYRVSILVQLRQLRHSLPWPNCSSQRMWVVLFVCMYRHSLLFTQYIHWFEMSIIIGSYTMWTHATEVLPMNKNKKKMYGKIMQEINVLNKKLLEYIPGMLNSKTHISG